MTSQSRNTVEVSWNLPNEIVERVNETARMAQCSPDEVVAGILAVLLSVRLRPTDTATRQIQDRLEKLSDSTLRRKSNSRILQRIQDRISQLLVLNNFGMTSSEQEQELDRLLSTARELENEREAARRLLVERKRAKATT